MQTTAPSKRAQPELNTLIEEAIQRRRNLLDRPETQDTNCRRRLGIRVHRSGAHARATVGRSPLVGLGPSCQEALYHGVQLAQRDYIVVRARRHGV